MFRSNPGNNIYIISCAFANYSWIGPEKGHARSHDIKLILHFKDTRLWKEKQSWIPARFRSRPQTSILKKTQGLPLFSSRFRSSRRSAPKVKFWKPRGSGTPRKRLTAFFCRLNATTKLLESKIHKSLWTNLWENNGTYSTVRVLSANQD